MAFLEVSAFCVHYCRGLPSKEREVLKQSYFRKKIHLRCLTEFCIRLYKAPKFQDYQTDFSYERWQDLQFDITTISLYPANIYLFKVTNRNIRKRCEICLKLTIKTPERRQWRRSGVINVNFKHISYIFLVFLSLTLNR